MRPALILGLCVALAVGTPALGAFNVEKGNGAVVAPAAGRRRFDVALADFGKPRYGALLTGQLVYPSEDAAFGTPARCGDVGCNFGCSPFNESSPPLSLPRAPGRRFVMLLDRGPRGDASRPCYFLSKALHAQAAGADALLVVNDGPGDLSTAVPPRDEGAARALAGLTISAGLISQEDGAALKELLRRGAPVAVALNWTDVLPRSSKVTWEFWTNSNDECGRVCDEQREFIKGFKSAARSLQVKGLVDFTPHYLVWVCQPGSSQEDCNSQCIRGGRYCCPDPDDNIHEGYSGADVLKMNIRSLCFAKVSKDRGEPWLWWQYADRFGEECRMNNGLYGPDCAQKVFDAVAGPNVGGPEGRAAWLACIETGSDYSDSPIPLLDAELAAQVGSDDDSSDGGTVAILPTVRVAGRQYRGGLSPGSVLRALCAAFPAGGEPSVCNEAWVSEDECREGAEGWLACKSGENSAQGRTRCINTFRGFDCDCGPGHMRVTDAVTGDQSCSAVNECLSSAVAWTREGCSCERCVCSHVPGGFNCSGPIPDYCTAEHDYGGCWRGSFGGRLHHACADNMRLYRYAAQNGRMDDGTRPFVCRCPPCFRATPSGGCEPACDPSACDASLGACLPGAPPAQPAPPPRGGGGGGGAGLGAALLVAAVAAAAVCGASNWHARQQLQREVRSILEDYVPLAGAPLADPNDPGDPSASTPTSWGGSRSGSYGRGGCSNSGSGSPAAHC
ncbi:vacuolar-sorting receptor-like protein [Raphidocelis subcapitata]|uniref:Vacuolar-sorting receptor-like protein n=1 Tax=Raphidocelis subcapitata TaxID=307507 RepID=A0A2V0NKH0_9CHLO|nr:vacuolar-sorting receptor-like protein [Raphidocelis subcapitata]|eukprot:GBF87811.1 vacuolar-sorting receptor-like protein [Raphidocelis subcapitata]